MRFAVESWDPEFGSSLEQELLDSQAPVDAEVEVGDAAWAPVTPGRAASAEPALLFVDGVRRVEAHVWISPPPTNGSTLPAHQGICASYAAGTVRCDGRAVVEATVTERALFCHPDGAESIPTRHGEFTLHAVPGDDPGRLTLALQGAMGRLEVEVATRSTTAGPVVVDGPLKDGQLRPGFVGYVKTHRTSYGGPRVSEVIGRLAPGERTPLLCLGGPRPRYTWYLRLPGPATHSWAGVVRLEIAAELPVADAAALADRLALSLPAFASTPHKDGRAPQNLFPIAGLERQLRHRLGDPHVVVRGLREAAAQR
jgi:hypothetical protein